MIAVAAAILALASPVVDRTLDCRVPGVGYPDTIRLVEVQASRRLGTSSPNGGVFDRPTASDGIAVSFQTKGFGRRTGFLWLKGCPTTSTPLAFATRGLRGGPVRFQDRHKCDVPERTLIRVRAVFQRAPIFRTDTRGGRIASGRIVSVQIVVATARGRPIAYLSADDATGTARLFRSSSRCFPA